MTKSDIKRLPPFVDSCGVAMAADGELLPSAGSYGRKSDPNEMAVIGQWATCRQRAYQDGYAIPTGSAFEFGDDGVTGRRESRPELERLRAVVRSGAAPFSRVYVRHRDRLSRVKDLRYLPALEREFEQFGVKICYCDDEKHTDFAAGGPESAVKMMINIFKDSQSSEELERLTDRVRIGLRRRVMAGYVVGSSSPYGTERWLARLDESRTPVERIPEGERIARSGHAVALRWNEERMPDIKFIFAELASGTSARSIARELKRQGSPPPSRSGGQWSSDAVLGIARNPIYMGDYHYGRTTGDSRAPVESKQATDMGTEPFIVRGFMPSPPIPLEQFERVQSVLLRNVDVRRRRMATRPDYLLSGMLRCAHCDLSVNGFTHRGTASQGKYRTYRHSQVRGAKARDHQRCPYEYTTFRAAAVEHDVIEDVRAILTEGRLLKLVRTKLEKLRGGARTPAREAERIKVADDIVALEKAAALCATKEIDAEARGNLELAASYRTAATENSQSLARQKRRLRDLAAELQQAEAAESRLPQLETRLHDLVAMFDQGEVERKKVLQNLIEVIHVDFSDGTATVHVSVPLIGAGPHEHTVKRTAKARAS